MKYRATVEGRFCILLYHVARNLRHVLVPVNDRILVVILKRRTIATPMLNLVPNVHSLQTRSVFVGNG